MFHAIKLAFIKENKGSSMPHTHTHMNNMHTHIHMLYISYICLLYTASSCINLVVCYKFATHKRDLADSGSGVEEEEAEVRE